MTSRGGSWAGVGAGEAAGRCLHVGGRSQRPRRQKSQKCSLERNGNGQECGPCVENREQNEGLPWRKVGGAETPSAWLKGMEREAKFSEGSLLKKDTDGIKTKIRERKREQNYLKNQSKPHFMLS